MASHITAQSGRTHLTFTCKYKATYKEAHATDVNTKV